MLSLQDLATAPFSGRVSYEDVAERIASIDLGDDPSTMRERFARLLLGEAASEPPPVGTSDERGSLVVPPLGQDLADGGRCLVWFHGGGYVFGSPETHWRPAAALASMLDVPVILPRYRLAPEHPWPSQLEDGLNAVRAAQDAGQRVTVAGDSAGGHLALTVALALGREGRPPDALALFSPNTDRTGLSGTREANTPRDPMNADEDDRSLAQMAFGNRPDDDPQVSPVLDDLSLLPPTHLEVGDREVLLGDAQVLAQRAQEAGAEVSLHVEPGAFHMWQLWTPWLPEADASLQRVASFLRRHGL